MPFQQEIFINCPYCGESIDILVDNSSEPQNYYEDCSVCCSPILFILTENDHGEIIVSVKREDD
jgi:hypothetical protein